ncbi:MAG: hypothetical protein QXK16_07415 [Sulfolobales archaeon]
MQLGSLTLGIEISVIAIMYALAVLVLLALIIKGLTYIVRPKKVPTSLTEIPKEVPREASGVDEVELAVAIAAIHKYLRDRGFSSVKRVSTMLGSNSWVTSWRLECSSDNVDYINYRRVRISSG